MKRHRHDHQRFQRQAAGTVYYGWAIVLVSGAAAFASGPGQSYVFSIVIDPILRDTGISRTALSTLYGIGTLISALMALTVSRLTDRFGPRKMLGIVGLALGCACMGLASATGPLGLFFSFAALRALGQGSLPVTGTLLTAQWFVRLRGRAMALVSLGFALSNAVLPPAVRFGTTTLGWRGTYVVLAVMVWLLLVPAAIWVVRNRPEDMGLHPDGAAQQPEHERVDATRGGERRLQPVWSSRRFWLLALSLTASPFIVTALVFHQVSLFAEQGLGPDVAAGVFVAFALSAAGMTGLAGFLVDRWGPKRLIVGVQVLLLLALLQLQILTTPLGATAYAMTLGAASGLQSVTSGVTWAHYYGRHGLGRVQGSASLVLITGAALAPMPLAALQQATGTYGPGLTALLTIPVACAGLAALVPGTHRTARPVGD